MRVRVRAPAQVLQVLVRDGMIQQEMMIIIIKTQRLDALQVRGRGAYDSLRDAAIHLTTSRFW